MHCRHIQRSCQLFIVFSVSCGQLFRIRRSFLYAVYSQQFFNNQWFSNLHAVFSPTARCDVHQDCVHECERRSPRRLRAAGAWIELCQRNLHVFGQHNTGDLLFGYQFREDWPG